MILDNEAIRAFSPYRFRSYRDELARAVVKLSQEMPIDDLENPFVSSEAPKMSAITGLEPGMIQARLNALKQKAATRRAEAMTKLDSADAKLATVDVAIEKLAAQIDKEADAALQEFAQHSNGGPL